MEDRHVKTSSVTCSGTHILHSLTTRAFAVGWVEGFGCISGSPAAERCFARLVIAHVVASYAGDTTLPSMVILVQHSGYSSLLFGLSRTSVFTLLVFDSPCTRSINFTYRYVQTFSALYVFRWLSRTGMLRILTSASQFTRSSDFHVPICSVF